MTVRSLVSLTALAALSCASAGAAPEPAPPRPRSIILLIADGAGAAHFTVGSMVRGDQFQTGRLPHTGLVMTSPLEDSVVTDSAAAATAYATGVATKYTRVGVDGAGEARTTVLEVAEQLGKSTGLVTTANFWDATPAAFAAHNKSRYESEDLIRQMLTSGAEIIAGGGAQHFGSEGRPTLAELAESTGYQLIDSRAKLDSVKGEKLFAVYPRADREVDFDEVRLPVLARWAIDHLSKDPDGFFLLIEHEGTDGAAHANLTDKFIASMVSFDEAVGVALDYATARKDVLIVVTGDHETGGLQILREKGKVMELGWATKSHTGEMIPIFAIGPGAETFHGLMTGADVGKKLLQFLRP